MGLLRLTAAPQGSLDVDWCHSFGGVWLYFRWGSMCESPAFPPVAGQNIIDAVTTHKHAQELPFSGSILPTGANRQLELIWRIWRSVFRSWPLDRCRGSSTFPVPHACRPRQGKPPGQKGGTDPWARIDWKLNRRSRTVLPGSKSSAGSRLPPERLADQFAHSLASALIPSETSAKLRLPSNRRIRPQFRSRRCLQR
jgi:hypothetical protein